MINTRILPEVMYRLSVTVSLSSICIAIIFLYPGHTPIAAGQIRHCCRLVTANRGAELNRCSCFVQCTSLAQLLTKKYYMCVLSCIAARCLWDGLPCSSSDFYTVLTDFGICYTFNSGFNSSGMVRFVTHTGQ